MHIVFLNIGSFFKNEKLLLFVIFICVISSAFIINFSYGFGRHSLMQRSEAEVDLKDIRPDTAEGAVFTKGDLQRYVEALGEDIHERLLVIYAAGDISEYGFTTDDTASVTPMRLRMSDGKYLVSEVTRSSWEENNLIVGRYISDEEEAEGRLVAMVGSDGRGGWQHPNETLKNPDGTITLFGKKYEVVGVYNAGMLTPIVPFLTIPDDIVIKDFSLTFEKNITRSIYERLISTAEEYIPGILVFPERELPDNDAVAVYNNMLVIAVVLSVLSIINFALLYRFVLKKRQRTLAVMRMCGCTRGKAAAAYFGECLILTVPAYLLGTGLNIVLVDRVFSKAYAFISQAYSVKVYAVIAAVYFAMFAVILLIMIFGSVSKTVKEEWRG